MVTTQLGINHQHSTGITIYKLLTTNSKSEIFNLIPAEDVVAVIHTIHLDLSRDQCEFVTAPSIENTQQLISISQIQTILMNDILKIVIKMPTVKNINYTLMSFIPLPSEWKGNTYKIRIMYDFYLLKHENTGTTLIPMTSNEESRCLNSKLNFLLCSGKGSSIFVEKQFLTREDFFYNPEIKAIDENKLILEGLRPAMQIEDKNHLLKLTADTYYLYIYNNKSERIHYQCREPLMFRVGSKIYNQTTPLYYPSYCELFSNDTIVANTHNQDVSNSSNSFQSWFNTTNSYEAR